MGTEVDALDLLNARASRSARSAELHRSSFPPRNTFGPNVAVYGSETSEPDLVAARPDRRTNRGVSPASERFRALRNDPREQSRQPT